MRERVAPLGDKNIVGATVTRLRLEQGITQKALMLKCRPLVLISAIPVYQSWRARPVRFLTKRFMRSPEVLK